MKEHKIQDASHRDDKRDPATTGAERRPDSTTKRERIPKEIGGRNGPEPTRYGDWEVNGRCTDF